MNYAISLTGASLTYDIDPPRASVSALEVYNEGPDILYYGDVPKYTSGTPLNINASEYVTTSITSGSAVITLGTDAPVALVQGMVLNSGGMSSVFPASTTVLSVSGRKITMSANATGSDSGVDGAFIMPTVATTTNAIPVQPGETVRFTANGDNPTASRAIRLLAASGATCAVRIRRSMI